MRFKLRTFFKFRPLMAFMLAIALKGQAYALSWGGIPPSAIAFLQSRDFLTKDTEHDVHSLVALLQEPQDDTGKLFWVALVRLDFEIDKANDHLAKFPGSFTRNRISADILKAGLAVITAHGNKSQIPYLNELKLKYDALLLNDPERLPGQENNYQSEIIPLFDRARVELEKREFETEAAPGTDEYVREGHLFLPSGATKFIQPPVSAPTAAPSEGDKEAFIKKIKSAGGPSVRAADLLNEGIADSKDLIEAMPDMMPQLSEIREALEREVIGQPEIIEQLLVRARKNILIAQKPLPDKLVIMGPSHLGGVASVKAYINALNGGDSKAEKDHLFQLPVLDEDLSYMQVEGSSSGLMQSDSLSLFVRWAVAHMGGKYKIMPALGNSSPYVVENKNWKPGTVLPGYHSPRKSAILIDNFQAWIKKMKDHILLNALEKGRLRINNAGNGLSEIEIPFDIFIRTTEGSEFINLREQDGAQVGDELSFDQMQRKWDENSRDKDLLRKSLTDGRTESQSSSKHRYGASSQLIDLLHDADIVLTRPLNIESIQKITEKSLRKFKISLRQLRNDLNIQFAPSVVLFLMSNGRKATDFAAGIDQDIETFLGEPFFAWAHEEEGLLKSSKRIELGIEGTENCVLTVNADGREFRIPISATKKGIVRQMPAEKLQKLLELESRLNESVFGIEAFSADIADALLVLEEKRYALANGSHKKKKATSFWFLGPSSVGKTELARAIAKDRCGSEDAALILRFNNINTVGDLRNAILGAPGEESKLARHHRQYGGHIVVLLDEFINDRTSAQVLEGLYDLFDEAKIKTGDGQELDMSFVTFIATGNIGQDWYSQIPTHIPMAPRMAAMHEIYQKMMKNPQARRAYLDKRLSPALINRVGEENIYFFSPLQYDNIRRLAVAKLSKAILGLQSDDGSRSWNLKFASFKDFESMIRTIEEDGFKLIEQGRSIDNFVTKHISRRLNALLLRHEIPSGANGQISYIGRTAPSEDENGEVSFRVEFPEFQKEVVLKISLEKQVHLPPFSQESEIMTTAHEAGHFLQTALLFPDHHRTVGVSRIQGVADIDGEIVVYLGLHSVKTMVRFEEHRQTIVRSLAVLYGGALAEILVTQGIGHHGVGSGNDIERATLLARRAVLRFGFSGEMGWQAERPDQDIDLVVQGFSESKREKYEKEVNALLDEGRNLALQVLIANFDNILIPFSAELAEKGKMEPSDIQKFLESHKVNLKLTPEQQARYREIKAAISRNSSIPDDGLLEKYTGELKVERDLIPEVRGFKVADLNQILAARKAAILSAVNLEEKGRHLVAGEGCLEAVRNIVN